MIIWTNSFAQEPEVRFDRISLEKELSQSGVTCILQDHLGFLWFATMNGLVKYDGFTFTTYIPEADNPHSIGTRDLLDVLEDHLGNLWIATGNKGLIKFDRDQEKFTSYMHDENDPNSLIANSINTLYEDKTGILWIGMNDEGLEKFNREYFIFK